MLPWVHKTHTIPKDVPVYNTKHADEGRNLSVIQDGGGGGGGGATSGVDMVPTPPKARTPTNAEVKPMSSYCITIKWTKVQVSIMYCVTHKKGLGNLI